MFKRHFWKKSRKEYFRERIVQLKCPVGGCGQFHSLLTFLCLSPYFVTVHIVWFDNLVQVLLFSVSPCVLTLQLSVFKFSARMVQVSLWAGDLQIYVDILCVVPFFTSRYCSAFITLGTKIKQLNAFSYLIERC